MKIFCPYIMFAAPFGEVPRVISRRLKKQSMDWER